MFSWAMLEISVTQCAPYTLSNAPALELVGEEDYAGITALFSWSLLEMDIILFNNTLTFHEKSA